MLIASVPYLNSIPLIRGLKYNIRKAPPALLDQYLRVGEVDIATAPVTSLFENPEWHTIPGIAIGTERSARSVLLCTSSPKIMFETVQSIHLDEESRTSANLIKVLLAKKYGRDLGEIDFVQSHPSNIEAKLLIGDKALKEHSNPTWKGNIYDLGQEWTEWTKLPFVFACWVTRSQNVDNELVNDLNDCVNRNLNSLDDWIGDIDGYDTELLKEYFTKNMNYRLGQMEQQGLLTFHRYLREMELLNEPFKLRFVK
jgi:chorismate dehydratase